MPGFGHDALDAHIADLIGGWRMEEASGNLADVLGVLTGVVSGTPNYQQTGAVDDCIDFDGSTDYVTIGDTGETCLTLALWVYTAGGITRTMSSEVLLQYGDDADYGDGRREVIFLGPCTGKLTDETVSMYGNPPGQSNTAITEELSSGWHHLVFRWNSGESRYDIIVDGVTKTVTKGTSDGHVAQMDMDELILGKWSYDSNAMFTGRMDEVFAWKVAISDAAVAALYNGGSGIKWADYLPQARGAFSLLNAFSAEARGRWAINDTYTAECRGRYAVCKSYSAEARGKWAVLSPYTAEARGGFKILLGCTAELRGRYRVANDALARYELFRGIDAAPDFDSAAWETFTTLPHETAALDPAPAGTERTYHFVLRARNKYDLASSNVLAWTVTVDENGDQVVTRPSAPDSYDVEPAAAGAVLVTASYAYTPDGEDAATKWLIYITDDGSDPDPDLDTPTEVTMRKSDGTARLRWTSSAFDDGDTIKVLVRTRRVDAGPVNVDSANTDIVSTTADTDGPAAPAGGIFFGSLYKQGQ